MLFREAGPGWLLCDVAPEIEKQAAEIRAERDRLYGNIYEEEKTDLRWVGEVGELCFNDWLSHQSGLTYEWVQEDAAGKPDFILRGTTVGLKTVKRKGPVLSSYTAQITARHAAEPVDHFFFASYEYPQRTLWMLGGCTRDDCLRHAVYYGPGDRVHANYSVRPGHAIYNVELKYLAPPTQWLRTIAGKQS